MLRWMVGLYFAILLVAVLYVLVRTLLDEMPAIRRALRLESAADREASQSPRAARRGIRAPRAPALLLGRQLSEQEPQRHGESSA